MLMTHMKYGNASIFCFLWFPRIRCFNSICCIATEEDTFKAWMPLETLRNKVLLKYNPLLGTDPFQIHHFPLIFYAPPLLSE